MIFRTLNKLYLKIVGYRSRIEYWSNSSVAAKLRTLSGMEKMPKSATSKEWDRWITQNQKSHPIAFWIVEEGLNRIQDIVYFPYDVYRNIRRHIKNRFIDKTHLLRTNLERGQWHEADERILHGIMETVVQYVEEELAHMQDLASRFNEDMSYIKDRREAGLKYLEWEISLGEDSLAQSQRAKEIKEVYLWWKDIYPNRPDPMDVSGWSEYCDTHTDIFGDKNDEERERVRKMLDKMHEIEQQYDDEETEMLIRAIKVRKAMWT